MLGPSPSTTPLPTPTPVAVMDDIEDITFDDDGHPIVAYVGQPNHDVGMFNKLRWPRLTSPDDRDAATPLGTIAEVEKFKSSLS